MTIQRTLAIIKPDAVAKGVAGQIIARIENAGFTILAARLIQMSLDEARGFYIVHRERPFYASLCAFMTQGPCLPMVLEGENAIQRWRDLMGATDFTKAAPPDKGQRLFDAFCGALRAQGIPIGIGTFGAHMRVALDGDGPVTLVVSTDGWAEGDLRR